MSTPVEKIKHYQILKPIGKGGMGEVFLAQDTNLDRKVAIKFLPKELQQDQMACERFLREGKSAASLDHPFICKIFDEFEELGLIITLSDVFYEWFVSLPENVGICGY